MTTSTTTGPLVTRSIAVATPGRAAGRISSAISAVRRAVAVPTPLGRTVIVIGFVAWVLGWRLGWQELMLAAAVCVLLLVASIPFTLGRMDVTVSVAMHPARVVVGQTANGQVTALNKSTGRLFPLRVELLIGRGVASFDIPLLAGGQLHDELFAIPTHRRAVIAVGPARTLRGDPIGLMRRTLEWPGVTNLYVHPKTISVDGLGAGFLRDLEGRTTDATSTSDVELHTLRDYVPGDDRRLVHWRTSARSGRLMVRQFVDTRRSHVAIVQSGNPADYAGEDEFELGVSILASLGVRAVRDQQSVAVLAAGRAISTTSPGTLLDGTSAIEFQPRGGSLSEYAAEAVRRHPDLSVAVLITGSGTSVAGVRAAAARFSPDVKVVVFRANCDGSSGVREIGSTLVMTLAALDDLPRIVRTVSQ